MKQSKVFVSLFLIIGLSSCAPTQDDRPAFLISIPASVLLQKEDPPLYDTYDILDTELKNIRISHWKNDVICLDSLGRIYQFGKKPWRTLLSDTLYYVGMEMDNRLMGSQMAQFTDDLATHDNLYQLSIEQPYIFTIPIPREVREEFGYGWFKTIMSTVEACWDNIFLKSRFRHAQRCYNLSRFVQAVSGFDDAYFEILYRDKVSGRIHLLHKLTNQPQEKEWGLYYYPAIYCGTMQDSFPNALLLTSSDSGELYQLDKALIIDEALFIQFPERDQYVKVVGDWQSADSEALTEGYFEDTERMNALIHSYFSGIR